MKGWNKSGFRVLKAAPQTCELNEWQLPNSQIHGVHTLML
jgi:hypothetical protein